MGEFDCSIHNKNITMKVKLLLIVSSTVFLGLILPLVI